MFGVLRLGRVGWTHFHQFLGAEMRYQLDMQILLVSTTIFVVFGKANMVQLIRSASPASGNVLFKQVWTWYLRTLQNNSLRNSQHSWPSRQTNLQLKTVKT